VKTKKVYIYIEYEQTRTSYNSATELQVRVVLQVISAPERLPPRQCHINGSIAEMLCTWSSGGTGAGRHRNERVKWVREPVSYTQP